MNKNLPCKEPNILKPGNYKTDLFNREPLFLVKSKNLLDKNKSFIVRSWQEAFALNGKASKEDINPQYIGALISGVPISTISPYLGIKRIPRANNINLDTYSYRCQVYDPFLIKDNLKVNNFDIKLSLIESLKKELRNNKNLISIEHSGGLDSNVILGSIIFGLNYPAEKIFTWTNFNKKELISVDKCRKFFKLRRENCLDNISYLSSSNISKNELCERNKKLISILGFPSQVAKDINSLEEIKKNKCTDIFSGLGGDQALSHKGSNIPTDLLSELRLIEFVKWMPSLSVLIKQLIYRSLSINARFVIKYFLRIKARNSKYALKRILVRNLTEKGKYLFMPFIIEDYPWEADQYAFLKDSIKNRISSDWIAIRSEEESNLAKFYSLKKHFPLLNEKIISILLQRDPMDFGENHEYGRLIMKKSFSEFIPTHLKLQNNEKENPISERSLFLKKKVLFQNLKEVPNFKESLKNYWNIDKIYDICESTLNNKKTTFMDCLVIEHTIDTLIKIGIWYDYLI